MENNELYQEAKRILTNLKLGGIYENLPISYQKIPGTHKDSFWNKGITISNEKAIELTKEYITSKL